MVLFLLIVIVLFPISRAGEGKRTIKRRRTIAPPASGLPEAAFGDAALHPHPG